MARKTTADTAVPTTRTGDGRFAIGGRPGIGPMYVTTTSDQGLPPQALRTADPAPQPGQPVTNLPLAQIAWVHAGKEIGRLKAAAAGLQRQIDSGILGANGAVSAYLIERQAAFRKDLATVQEQIAELESMTDAEVRQWAYDQKGVR